MNNSNTTTLNHFTNIDETLTYLKENPTFVSGFTSGEGSFTGYMGVDSNLKRGIQPSCEFNVVQNSGDLLLLQAISLFFQNIALSLAINTKISIDSVYDRSDGTHAFMVRNLIDLNLIITPFFIKYPLVGTKSYEFEKFINILQLIINKKHVGSSLENRDAMVELAIMFKDLNLKAGSHGKRERLDIIINWLTSLNEVPSLAAKKELAAELALFRRGRYNK